MRKLVFLTGAGISKESGIPTFRDAVDGLWENHDINEVCMAGCFQKNEEMSYKFYNTLRDNYKDCKPNKAHELIAELEKYYDVTVITQNVDSLHEQAGSTDVLHLHGELSKMRAMDDPNFIKDWPEDLTLSPECVVDGHQMRPHIVMFAEPVPNIEKAQKIMCDADICVVVGTSFNVYPAAGLVDFIDEGKPIYYVDPYPAPTPEYLDIEVVKEAATVGMQKVFDILSLK